MGTRKAAAIALSIIGIAFRAIAIILCVLTVALCFNGVTAKFNIVGLIVDITRALPDVIAGYGLIPTPLGGVFRLDFALMAVISFLLDYVCARLSRLMR